VRGRGRGRTLPRTALPRHVPARSGRYPTPPSLPSRSVGQGRKRRERLIVRPPAERDHLENATRIRLAQASPSGSGQDWSGRTLSVPGGSFAVSLRRAARVVRPLTVLFAWHPGSVLARSRACSLLGPCNRSENPLRRRTSSSASADRRRARRTLAVLQAAPEATKSTKCTRRSPVRRRAPGGPHRHLDALPLHARSRGPQRARRTHTRACPHATPRQIGRTAKSERFVQACHSHDLKGGPRRPPGGSARPRSSYPGSRARSSASRLNLSPTGLGRQVRSRPPA
jgi:hypothetical protein